MHDMTPMSFSDLYADARGRRDAGDVEGGVTLLRENLKAYPLHKGVVHLVLAEMLVAAGRSKEGVDVLQEAFTAGCRYKAEWLTNDAALAPIAADPRFVKIVKKVDERYRADAAAARPDLLVRAPAGDPPASGRPLLIALHGNNSNARDTARFWSSAVQDGWVLAVPQSSEIASSPDAFTWNDRDRARREIEPHIVRVKELHRIDASRIVLAGFSMGGLQAVALPLALGFAVRGIIPIAAWLPNVDEFAQLVDSGAGRTPPAYIVVGERDPSYDGAMQLAALLQKDGARVKLDVRAGMGHQYPPDMDATLSRALALVGA
jgi:predicted esterase